MPPIRWAPTASSSSNTPRPSPSAWRAVRAHGLRARRAAPLEAVTLYRQGDVNFILNHEPDSFAQAFARVHGPSVCAFAIRVQDAAAAYKRALEARRQSPSTAGRARWSSISPRSTASAAA